MYTAGQIIDRKEHIKFANWKAVNSGNLISVSLGGGQYRLEEIPAPTIEELSAQKRAERNAILDATDKFTSVPDYPITDEKREQYKAYRQYLRDLPEQAGFPNVEIMTFEKYVESITQ